MSQTLPLLSLGDLMMTTVGVKLDPAVTDDGDASGSERSEIIKDKGFLGFFPL